MICFRQTSAAAIHYAYNYHGFTYNLVSTPFRTTSDQTMGWTRTKLDKMNRVVEIAHYSGGTAPPPWGGNSSTTGIAATSYDSQVQAVTDEAGSTRALTGDGLNRLSQVLEAGAATTSYTYDTHDNLTQVNQSGQTRSFSYSSLGRLTSASNPENGTYYFAYDNNGNLTAKSDINAAGYSIVYDHLNRINTKTYTDGSPTVTYQYLLDLLTYETGVNFRSVRKVRRIIMWFAVPREEATKRQQVACLLPLFS